MAGGEVKYGLGVDTEAFTEALDGAAEKFQEFLGEIGAGIAGAVAFEALAEDLKSVVEVGGELAETFENLGAATGLSMDALQSYSNQAQTVGLSVDTVGSLVEKMSKAIAAGKVDVSSLGLSMEQLQQMSPQQAFDAVNAGLAAMGPGIAQTAQAMAIFGKGGAQDLILIQEQAQLANQELKEFGGTVSGDDLAALASFKTATNAIGVEFQNFEENLAAAIVETPAMGAAVKFLEDGIAQLSAYVKDNRSTIQAWVSGGLYLVVSAIQEGLSAIQALGYEFFNFSAIVDKGEAVVDTWAASFLSAMAAATALTKGEGDAQVKYWDDLAAGFRSSAAAATADAQTMNDRMNTLLAPIDKAQVALAKLQESMNNATASGGTEGPLGAGAAPAAAAKVDAAAEKIAQAAQKAMTSLDKMAQSDVSAMDAMDEGVGSALDQQIAKINESIDKKDEDATAWLMDTVMIGGWSEALEKSYDNTIAQNEALRQHQINAAEDKAALAALTASIKEGDAALVSMYTAQEQADQASGNLAGVIQDKLNVGIAKLAQQFDEGKIDLDAFNASLASLQATAANDQLALMFKNLGTSISTIGTLLKDAGVGKNLTSFVSTLASTVTNMPALSKDLSSMEGFGGNLFSETGGGFSLSNIAGFLGAAGPIAGAVSSIVSGIASLFGGTPEWQKVQDAISNQLGVAVTEGTGKAIAQTETKDNVSRNIAEELNVSSILSDALATSGDTATQVWPEINALMEGWKDGAVSAADATDQLNKTWDELATSAANGSIESTQAMIQMEARAKQLGESIPDMTKALTDEMKTAVTGLDAFFKGVGDLPDIVGKGGTLTSGGQGTQSLTQGAASEEILGSLFNAEAGLEGVAQAAIDLSPAFADLKKTLPAGVPLGADYAQAMQMLSLMSNATFKGAATGAAGLADTAKGLIDSGSMSNALAGALGTSAMTLFNQALGVKGATGKTAEEAILPLLTQLQRAQELGAKLDPSSTALLAKAQADGLLPLKDVNTQQLDQLKVIAQNTARLAGGGAGGGTVYNIPGMAEGGVMTGPGLAMLHGPEAVVPLGSAGPMLRALLGAGPGGGGGAGVHVESPVLQLHFELHQQAPLGSAAESAKWVEDVVSNAVRTGNQEIVQNLIDRLGQVFQRS